MTRRIAKKILACAAREPTIRHGAAKYLAALIRLQGWPAVSTSARRLMERLEPL